MRLLAVAVILGAFLAGCQAPGSDGVSISHVHGLAYEPGEGAVYVATHHGVAKGTPQGDPRAWNYVGSERYDYMGFTQDAATPGTFYSSGHPDDRLAFGGVHVGLRRSTDGAQTWEQRSLKGQVDFHALTSLASGAGHVAGYFQGQLKVSQDGGLTWHDHATDLPISALAASAGWLWAATSSGLRRTADYVTWTDASAGRFTGTVSSVAASRDGTLVLLGTGDGRTGTTYRSADGGATWEQLTPGVLRDSAAPVIFAIDPHDASHVFASTAAATIMESKDKGASWQMIRE